MTFNFIFDMLQRSKEGRAENALRRERRKMRTDKLYGRMKYRGRNITPEKMGEIRKHIWKKEKAELRYMAWGYLLVLLFSIAVAALLVNRYVI